MDPKHSKPGFQPLQQVFIFFEVIFTTILGAISFDWNPTSTNEEDEVDSDTSTGTVIIHDTDDEDTCDRDTLGDVD